MIDEPPFDFNKIDTSRVTGISDEKLLIRLKHMELVGVSGWGLVAELAKRYADVKGIARDIM